ncbi:MAG: ornithine cyclodeaminase family protein, partial [Woeseia sp.]
MRTYDREAVACLLPYGRLVDALEDAFRTDVNAPGRTHYQLAVPGDADATLLLMPAWRSGESLGVKIATIFPGNLRKNLPSVSASYLLLDATTGMPRAFLDGAELTLRRTAAASALASRKLSRPDASTLLMVGTGKLAPQLVAAHATVRNIEKVLVWGRRPEAVARLLQSFTNTSFTATAAGDLADAVARADIISCATLATEPLIRGAWLRKGQHVDLVGAFRPDMREADGEALARADVYVDTFEGALAEAGEIIQSLQEGSLERSGIIGDLFALARGTCRARQSADAITLFKSVGT